MYMLDTNILVTAIRHKDHPLRNRLLDAIEDGLCISTITYMELMYGVNRSTNPEKNRMSLNALLAWIQILPFDEDAAACAGEIMAFLAEKGTPIGDRDVLIAGHARSLSIPLITHNMREFERVPGLKVEDWQV